ncbi:hypothetical protein DITRI_Ditri13aG0149000 [Diplodiscus trichospermus]
MSDWPQFYQQNRYNQETSNRSAFGDHDDHQGSEAAAVVSTTTITTSSSVAVQLGSGPGGSSGGGHLSPEGRVGKPGRRRTRASRRTPTTLLNTDTTNFRAMVQQFTGGPSALFSAGAQTSFGLSFEGSQPYVNPGSMMAPPAGFHLQYQLQQHQHRYQPHMFSLNSNNINSGATDLFLHRLAGNPRPNMEARSEGFGMELGVPSHAPPRSNFHQ